MSEEIELILPEKDGWYWVILDGDESGTPCWFMKDAKCFIPAGLGDASRYGIDVSDIDAIGPEIIEPEF